MSTENRCGRTRLQPEDRAFLERSNEILQTMVAFVRAQLFGDRQLAQRAGQVLVYREGRVESVEEILEQCTNHRWNVTIYEAWAYATAQKVRSTARTLGPIAGEALLVFAQDQGMMAASGADAIEAIEEAHAALYGVRTTACI